MERKLPAISIIIPVYREEELINGCLEDLAGIERISEAEVVVVDGGGGSTLHAIEKKEHSYSLITLESEKGRGKQQNRGAQAARARVCLFLHVDTSLPKNALSLIEHVLISCDAGAFRLGIDSKRLFLRLGTLLANVRAAIIHIPYGDQAYFMKRELFFKVGGFQNIPIMEDVALMVELRKRGVELGMLKEKVITSDRRWRKEGMLKATFRNWFLFASYRLGAPAEKLAHRYRPHIE